MNKRTKVICAIGYEMLELCLNKVIREIEKELNEIVDVKFSCDGEYFNALIIYEVK